jgi:hypothetical protein
MAIVFVVAGTRDHQDIALMRMGARPVNGIQTVSSELFDDDLRLLYFDMIRPTSSTQHRMRSAAAILNLADGHPCKSEAPATSVKPKSTDAWLRL